MSIALAAGVSGAERQGIRVRIVDNSSATLTIKNRGAGMRRLELEYAIPVLEAESLVSLRSGTVIEKVRHILPHARARR